MKFALNHMTAPAMPVADFFDLALSLGIHAVEIRNDLANNAILDGTAPGEIRKLAEDRGIEIISINALQRFNEWSEARSREADELIAYARDCGANALVLVPKNDGTGIKDGERQQNLREALSALKPRLEAAGVIGLVEPLGFAVCSLSSKQEAADAIRDVSGEDVFRLVHDTFHHHLAGEPAIFPAFTGLVHISGVTDPAVSFADMRDSHRVLVDRADRLDNIGQILALRAAGYDGPLSFEPFADSVHALSDPGAAVKASMDYITAAV
ncbi:MAG: TIM barrel protein [Hydrogenophaga sp.]|nr:TIM barrel protein [Hydrogenophaga sp.]